MVVIPHRGDPYVNVNDVLCSYAKTGYLEESLRLSTACQVVSRGNWAITAWLFRDGQRLESIPNLARTTERGPSLPIAENSDQAPASAHGEAKPHCCDRHGGHPSLLKLSSHTRLWRPIRSPGSAQALHARHKPDERPPSERTAVHGAR